MTEKGGFYEFVSSKTQDGAQNTFDAQQTKSCGVDQSDRISVEMERVIKDIASRSVARAEEQLEGVMRETLRMLREELRAEFADGNKALWARLSELPSRSHVHRFVKCQVAMKEQLDLVTKTVCTIAGTTSKNGSDGIAEAPVGEKPGMVSPERSQLEAKFEVLCAEVRALLVEIGVETEKLQEATARCESARSAVDALHEQLTLQYEETTKRVTVLEQSGCDQHPSARNYPSKEDVLRIFDACHSLRLDDAHAEQQISDLRASIAKQSEDFEAERKKIFGMIEALTSSSESLVARI